MREDWIECKFGDVLNIKNGKNQKLVENSEGQYPIYGSSGIIGWADEYLCDEETTIIGRKGTINTPIFVNTKFWNVDTAFGLTPFNVLNSRLLFFFCKLFNFHALDKSTTIPSLAKSDLLQIDFSLPPLPEQRAIVKKLESKFSSLDAGVADLKKAQQQLKIYRQAVLKKAFEGELTNSEMELISLSNLTTILGDGLHGTPKYSHSGEYFFINGNNLKEGKIILKPETKRVDKSEFEKYKKNLGDSTVLVSINGTIGNTAFYNNENVVLGKSACYFNLNNEIDKFYIRYNLTTKRFLHYAVDNATGSTIMNVGLKTMREYLVPVPKNRIQQHQIVKQIESRLSVCDSVEQSIKESLEKAEALRQSILKKAFEGNLLTAQELAECKQAKDYEPASVLLERIKAEQNKATAKPSKKKVAEPLVVAKVETPITKISVDIHAGLIAKVIKIHEENPASIDNLSHIKCEKIAHLVEYHLQIPLGRQPVKDAAGPDDFPHLKKVEHRAEKAGFFNKINKSIGHSYSSTRNSNKVIEKFESSLSVEKNKQLNDLLALFLKFDLEVSEIIATTYAGWNNLILNGNTNPSDEEIVYESRENWSERKLKIARERFFKAIEWMRKNEIVPTGYGAVVPFPKKKK